MSSTISLFDISALNISFYVPAGNRHTHWLDSVLYHGHLLLMDYLFYSYLVVLLLLHQLWFFTFHDFMFIFWLPFVSPCILHSNETYAFYQFFFIIEIDPKVVQFRLWLWLGFTIFGSSTCASRVKEVYCSKQTPVQRTTLYVIQKFVYLCTVQGLSTGQAWRRSLLVAAMQKWAHVK
jgi:hypothetical protein